MNEPISFIRNVRTDIITFYEERNYYNNVRTVINDFLNNIIIRLLFENTNDLISGLTASS